MATVCRAILPKLHAGALRVHVDLHVTLRWCGGPDGRVERKTEGRPDRGEVGEWVGSGWFGVVDEDYGDYEELSGYDILCLQTQETR